MSNKMTILISDDSRMNRELLSSMLEELYEIVEAEDGAQAVDLLREDASRFSALLLDIQMPNMDGFEVLAYMNKYHWIETLPVIIISSETSSAYIERAYNLGATDYISRPFDEAVVRRRIHNTILLHSKHKLLMNIIQEQVREKRKSDQLMISILSNIVEFRNGESGLHVMRVHVITRMLLEQLLTKTDRYSLTQDDIDLISTASALHDIGKICIPDAVLNKPGRYTAEEFEIMKGHAAAGGDLLRKLPYSGKEPLLKVAYEVCRWHHERYDGKGYPDGLKGDDIPISAQAVALADVYDALTSERSYKRAYSHAQSMEMILGGQCGAFNPLLLSCLQDIGNSLVQKLRLKSPSFSDPEEEDYGKITQQLSHYGLLSTEQHLKTQEYLRQRLCFMADESNEIFFSYSRKPPLLRLNNSGAAQLNLDSVVEDPLGNKAIRDCMDGDTLKYFEEKLAAATPACPDFQVRVTFLGVRSRRSFHCLCHTIWLRDEPTYMGIVGKLTDIDRHRDGAATRGALDSLALLSDNGYSISGGEARALLSCMGALFDTARLVDPVRNIQITMDDGNVCRETPYCCYQIWNREEKCENCISAKCVISKGQQTKLEFVGDDIYHVRASYVEVDGQPYSLELVDRAMKGIFLHGLEKDYLVKSLDDYQREIYTDSVTGGKNRRYYDEKLKRQWGIYAVVVVDVDQFKSINDTYGHSTGDLALKKVNDILSSCLREIDSVARFGGDEFVLVFPDFPPEEFAGKLEEMVALVRTEVLPGHAQVHLSISAGGIYGSGLVSELAVLADDLMYQAKRENCGFKVRLQDFRPSL